MLINAEYFSEEFGASQIFEIQLTFREFLTIKKALHKYYEILRANGVKELIAKPIFKTKVSARALFFSSKEANRPHFP